jgi:hypothetical protein
MNLTITQIEKCLPSFREIYKLWEEYIEFSNLGYNSAEEQGLVTFHVVLQNIIGQGKDCGNYNEEMYVKQVNKGLELIYSYINYANWHFLKFIQSEIESIIMCVRYEG